MTQTSAFLVTLAIEVPIVVAGAALARTPRTLLWWITFVALGANAFTHPLLWLADAALQPNLALAPRWTLLEVAVVAVEGTAYAFADLGVRRGVLLSLAANAASFLAGLAWFVLHG